MSCFVVFGLSPRQDEQPLSETFVVVGVDAAAAESATKVLTGI